MGRGAHRNVLLLQLGRELEGGLSHIAHGLQRIEISAGHGLARWHHAHVDVLLVGGLDLLLLLLQQLDLLLNCQLLHCEKKEVSIKYASEGRSMVNKFP